MKILTVKELQLWMEENRSFELIDVRQPEEYAVSNLGGKLIPLSLISQHLNDLPEDRPIVMQCRSGGRSAVAQEIALRYNADLEVYNLKGGILAWKKEIDPTISVA